MNYYNNTNISTPTSNIAQAELSTVNLYTKKLAIQPVFDFKIFRDDFYINTHGVSVTESTKSFTTLNNGLFHILNKNNQPMVFNGITLTSVRFRNESAVPANTLKHVFVNTTYNASNTYAYDNYNILFRSNVIGTLSISRSIEHANDLNFILNPFQSIHFGATYTFKNVNLLDVQYYGASNINKDKKVGTLDMRLTIKSFTDLTYTTPIYDSMTITVNLVNSGYVPSALSTGSGQNVS